LSQLNKAGSPRASEVKKQLANLRQTEPKGPDVKALSFLESTNRARAAIHIRGDFLRKGDEVNPGTPAVLPPLNPRPRASRAACGSEVSRAVLAQSNAAPSNAPARLANSGLPPAGRSPDRLDLARWIVAPENPLTARVAVNHIWQHLYWRGLVGTPEDFGTRGERPSHPELLDWLAVAFVSAPDDDPHAVRPGLGWSRKALIKLIVTSATYRQSSHFRSELQEHDPQNLLLARQNRFRLESESIRDASLAVAGLLN